MRQFLQDCILESPLFTKRTKYSPDRRVIAANHVVTLEHPTLLLYDPGGASRDVLMPLASTATGVTFIIVNTADAAENLVIKDSTDTTTFNTIAQNGAGIAYCDGVVWWVYPLNSTLSESGVNATFSGTFNADGAATFGSTVGITGLLSLTVMPKIPSATVAAAGTVQGDAALIATGFTLVSGADDTKGVKLPAAAAGLVCIIKVGAGADLKLYPNTSDTINGGAANASITVVDDVAFMVVAYDAVDWYTVPLLPS